MSGREPFVELIHIKIAPPGPRLMLFGQKSPGDHLTRSLSKVVSSRGTTASTATRRARRANAITTRWAPVTKSVNSCSPESGPRGRGLGPACGGKRRRPPLAATSRAGMHESAGDGGFHCARGGRRGRRRRALAVRTTRRALSCGTIPGSLQGRAFRPRTQDPSEFCGVCFPMGLGGRRGQRKGKKAGMRKPRRVAMRTRRGRPTRRKSRNS